jgi:hypothetical protein
MAMFYAAVNKITDFLLSKEGLRNKGLIRVLQCTNKKSVLRPASLNAFFSKNATNKRELSDDK